MKRYDFDWGYVGIEQRENEYGDWVRYEDALAHYSKELDHAYAEGRKDEAADWNNVGRNGPPPCDSETVFVGINTAGFACCFNEATHDGVCSMQGPELSTVQMSGLQWWRALERPAEEQK